MASPKGTAGLGGKKGREQGDDPSRPIVDLSGRQVAASNSTLNAWVGRRRQPSWLVNAMPAMPTPRPTQPPVPTATTSPSEKPSFQPQQSKSKSKPQSQSQSHSQTGQHRQSQPQPQNQHKQKSARQQQQEQQQRAAQQPERQPEQQTEKHHVEPLDVQQPRQQLEQQPEQHPEQPDERTDEHPERESEPQAQLEAQPPSQSQPKPQPASPSRSHSPRRPSQPLATSQSEASAFFHAVKASGIPSVSTSLPDPVLPSPAPSDEFSPCVSISRTSPNNIGNPFPLSSHRDSSVRQVHSVVNDDANDTPIVSPQSRDPTSPTSNGTSILQPNTAQDLPHSTASPTVEMALNTPPTPVVADFSHTGVSPQDGGPSVPSSKRRRIDRNPSLLFLDSLGALTKLESYKQQDLGLDEAVEQPRFALVKKACLDGDLFFIALHQLFCLWTESPVSVHELGDRRNASQLDQAFESLESVLKPNSRLKKEILSWYSSFPMTLSALLPMDLYRRAVNQVIDFAHRLSNKWTSLMQEHAGKLGYPLLMSELINTFWLYSPTLQIVMFRSSRRTLGVSDYPMGVEMDELFKADQMKHRNPDGSYRHFQGSQYDDYNKALIQKYRSQIARLKAGHGLQSSGLGRKTSTPPVASAVFQAAGVPSPSMANGQLLADTPGEPWSMPAPTGTLNVGVPASSNQSHPPPTTTNAAVSNAQAVSQPPRPTYSSIQVPSGTNAGFASQAPQYAAVTVPWQALVNGTRVDMVTPPYPFSNVPQQPQCPISPPFAQQLEQQRRQQVQQQPPQQQQPQLQQQQPQLQQQQHQQQQQQLQQQQHQQQPQLQQQQHQQQPQLQQQQHQQQPQQQQLQQQQQYQQQQQQYHQQQLLLRQQEAEQQYYRHVQNLLQSPTFLQKSQQMQHQHIQTLHGYLQNAKQSILLQHQQQMAQLQMPQQHFQQQTFPQFYSPMVQLQPQPQLQQPLQFTQPVQRQQRPVQPMRSAQQQHFQYPPRRQSQPGEVSNLRPSTVPVPTTLPGPSYPISQLSPRSQVITLHPVPTSSLRVPTATARPATTARRPDVLISSPTTTNQIAPMPANTWPRQAPVSQPPPVRAPVDRLIPPPGVRISPQDYPHTPYDKKSIENSLHQVLLRSPKRVLKLSPTTTRERYYQSVKAFALGPVPIGPQAHQYTFTFNVEKSIAERFTSSELVPGEASFVNRFSNGSLRLRLRCCNQPRTADPIPDYVWVNLESAWPEHMFVSLNDQVVGLKRKQHHSKDLPAEISDAAQAGTNTLLVSVFPPKAPLTQQIPFLAVEIVEVLSHSAILQMVQSTGRTAASETREVVRRRLARNVLDANGDDDDLEIADEGLSIDLVDPFAFKIFSIPVRGKACTHLECFDLENWLETRLGKKSSCSCGRRPDCKCPKEPSFVDKWKCPLCNGDARPYSLRVDEFLVEVRTHLEQNKQLLTKSITVFADGTWKAKDTADNDNSDYESDQNDTHVAAKPTPRSSVPPRDIIELDDD